MNIINKYKKESKEANIKYYFDLFSAGKEMVFYSKYGLSEFASIEELNIVLVSICTILTYSPISYFDVKVLTIHYSDVNNGYYYENCNGICNKCDEVSCSHLNFLNKNFIYIEITDRRQIEYIMAAAGRINKKREETGY